MNKLKQLQDASLAIRGPFLPCCSLLPATPLVPGSANSIQESRMRDPRRRLVACCRLFFLFPSFLSPVSRLLSYAPRPLLSSSAVRSLLYVNTAYEHTETSSTLLVDTLLHVLCLSLLGLCFLHYSLCFRSPTLYARIVSFLELNLCLGWPLPTFRPVHAFARLRRSLLLAVN